MKRAIPTVVAAIALAVALSSCSSPTATKRFVVGLLSLRAPASWHSRSWTCGRSRIPYPGPHSYALVSSQPFLPVQRSSNKGWVAYAPLTLSEECPMRVGQLRPGGSVVAIEFLPLPANVVASIGSVKGGRALEVDGHRAEIGPIDTPLTCPAMHATSRWEAWVVVSKDDLLRMTGCARGVPNVNQQMTAILKTLVINGVPHYPEVKP